MEELATNEVGEDGLGTTNMVHGVRRRVVRFCGPFHIHNLAVKDASIKTFGDLERDPDNKESQHSQILSILGGLGIDYNSEKAPDLVFSRKSRWLG